jgi:hypothetical protein
VRKTLAQVVADELKKGGEFAQSSLVIVADADDNILFECGGDSSDNNLLKSLAFSITRLLGASDVRNGSVPSREKMVCSRNPSSKSG